MKTESIFKDWAASVDLTKTRVIKFPSYIFLCGGRISPSSDNYFDSCRDIFYSHIRNNNYSFSKNVVLAEDVIKYFESSVYQDLLSFEKDLASLSALTVIFSESPGAIAELGSFSVLEYIQKRILVVLHEDHSYDQNSFIWKGPISFLRNIAKANGCDDPILIYNWKNVSHQNAVCRLELEDFSDVSDLSDAIELIMKKRDKTNVLKKDHAGHIMLLISSILNVIQIATTEEIIYLLNAFDLKKHASYAEKYLSLLKSLDIIDFAPYRNYKYFATKRPQIDWLKWAYHNGDDTFRWTTKFLSFYEKNQEEKIKALRSHFKIER